MYLYYKVVAYVMAGIFGLCVGSFLNVVIYRVPLGMSVAQPASHCPGCKNPIKWYDNIPVLSYILLGGKCRNCHEKISVRYTLVEILNAVLWLLSVFCFWDKGFVFAIISALTLTVLVCICFIDLENMLIFDRFQIMLGVLGIGYTLADCFLVSKELWLTHVIGGVAGFAVFWLLAFFGEKIAGREALGGGDIKLCAVMGLLLGWQKWIFGCLIASLAACLVLIVFNKKRDSGREYPFAPFLTGGFAVALLFGDAIIEWYLSILIGI